jgi:chondroitin 4-sulfotransferase 11
MEPLVYRQPWVNNSGQILLTRMIYIERQEHLQKMCNLGVSNGSAPLILSDDELQKGTFDHILVDEKHRLLYCYVPKVR